MSDENRKKMRQALWSDLAAAQAHNVEIAIAAAVEAERAACEQIARDWADNLIEGPVQGIAEDIADAIAARKVQP